MSEGGDPRAKWVLGVPRWYLVAMIVLTIGVVIVWLLTSREVKWNLVLVGAVIVVMIAGVLFAVRYLPGGSKPHPAEERLSPSPGWTALLGIGWALSVIPAIISGRYLFGAWGLGFGLLTAAAFGSEWLRARRARRGTVDPASVEGKPPG